MDDTIEIDLRKLIQQLLRRWWLIVGLAAILAILAFVVTSLRPPTYQATAIVAVTQPRYQLNFDSKIQTMYTTQPASNAYLDLATSDEVLVQVYDQWTERPDSITGLQDLRKGVIQVSSGKDASILKLTVETGSPAQSARLANLWASALITKADAIYFGQEQQLPFLEDQLASVKHDLDQAEQALIDFEAQNQLDILTNQLSSALQAQRDYLAIQRSLTYLSQSLQGLRTQLAASRAGDPTTADQLSALLLQVQTYNTQIGGYVNAFPLTIQFTDPAVIGTLDKPAQLTLLDNLDKSIQDRSAQLADDLKALDPQILSLQQAVQTYQINKNQLQRAQSLTEQTYTTLARKVDEVRISDQDPVDRLQLASTALPSSEPLPRSRLIYTILAGFTGGLLALVGILVWDWWRGQSTPEAA